MIKDYIKYASVIAYIALFLLCIGGCKGKNYSDSNSALFDKVVNSNANNTISRNRDVFSPTDEESLPDPTEFTFPSNLRNPKVWNKYTNSNTYAVVQNVGDHTSEIDYESQLSGDELLLLQELEDYFSASIQHLKSSYIEDFASTGGSLLGYKGNPKSLWVYEVMAAFEPIYIQDPPPINHLLAGLSSEEEAIRYGSIMTLIKILNKLGERVDEYPPYYPELSANNVLNLEHKNEWRQLIQRKY